MTIYVPTCSSTNPVNYLAVQCLEVPKYCWCVHPATGEPIPGTSMLEAKPQCAEEEPMPKSKQSRKNREISRDSGQNVGNLNVLGCSGKSRMRFLRRLVSAIKTEMIMT
ncbi:hypothetical protein GCK32_019860, partial [Trichostrongylus colubriformis]